MSSSSLSSSSSESSLWFAALTDPENYRRELLGYSVPVIDPESITEISELSRDQDVILGNLVIAFFFTLILGVTGTMLLYLSELDSARFQRIVQRLPFQLVFTLLLIALVRALIPDAAAQGFIDGSSGSPLRIPLYALLFFLIVGISNALFNALVLEKGSVIDAGVERFFGKREFQKAFWFVLILVLLYGIVGAHINPSFRLFPTEQGGIIIVAVISTIVGAYAAEILRFLIAKKWKFPAWFEANMTGFVVALLCVVITREFSLNPGFIYGLPVGLFLGFQGRSEGALQFWSMLWMLSLAVVIWLLIPGIGGYQIPADIGNLLFVLLIEGMFFELLPLPGLPGESIFRWQKILWSLLCFVTVFFLFHTLFNPQGTLTNIMESPPALTSVMLLCSFAVGVILLWSYMVLTSRHRLGA